MSSGSYMMRWEQKFDSFPLLEHVRSMISSTHPLVFNIRTLKVFPGKQYPSCRLILCSKRLIEDAIVMLGCKPGRKSYDLQLPELIPEPLLPSLIRGIADGDGSWAFDTTNAAMSFELSSANESFLLNIRDIINEQCSLSSLAGNLIPSHMGSHYYLRYRKISDCNQIGQWLYQPDIIGTSPYMQQKYERFQFFLQLYVGNGRTKRTDRRSEMMDFRKYEANKRHETLQSLISMCNQNSEPSHFRFSKSFRAFAEEQDNLK